MDNLNGGTPPKNKTTKKSIPTAALEVLALARSVSAKWLLTPSYTLDWTTAADFKRLVEHFETLQDERTTAGHVRTSTVSNLTDVNDLINANFKYLKRMIEEEYGDDKAQAYFSEFGIEHDSSYHFPRDGHARQAALQYLLRALTARGWVTQKYGLNFWTPIVEQYNSFFAISSNVKGTISVAVQNKQETQKEIVKTLKAMVFLIRANNPNTYKGVLRDWGFLKEQY